MLPVIAENGSVERVMELRRDEHKLCTTQANCDSLRAHYQCHPTLRKPLHYSPSFNSIKLFYSNKLSSLPTSKTDLKVTPTHFDMYGRIPHDEWMFTNWKLTDPSLFKKTMIEEINEEMPEAVLKHTLKFLTMLISMTVLGLPFVWFLGSKMLSWLWVHDSYAEYAAMEAEVMGSSVPIATHYKGRERDKEAGIKMSLASLAELFIQSFKELKVFQRVPFLPLQTKQKINRWLLPLELRFLGVLKRVDYLLGFDSKTGKAEANVAGKLVLLGVAATVTVRTIFNAFNI